MTDETNASPGGPQPAAPPLDMKSRLIDALMALAAERVWEEISISDVAGRAGVSLADFRDQFPSKGAIVAAFARKIDRIVLEGSGKDLADETAKERLFDTLMRRLDAMAPYREGVEGVFDWSRREPLAASALNGVALNSMRFMLEASGIDSEGPLGTLKLQGLVLAFNRVMTVWFQDEPDNARTMAVLDRELQRGGRFMARAEDIRRVTSPLRTLARALMESGRNRSSTRRRSRYDDGEPEAYASESA